MSNLAFGDNPDNNFNFMISFSQLTGIGSSNKKSSATNPLKTRIPGSAIKFKKKITKQGMRKIIRTTRVNGKMIDSNKLRDQLIGLVKKAGTKGLSGKQLEKKLREDYKMDIKDRKRVIKGITKYWAKSEEVLTAKHREKIKRLNVAAYNVERDKESVIGDILKTKGGDKIAGERLGVKAAGVESNISALGKMPKSGVADDYNNKSKFATKNNNASSVAGGFGTKLGGTKLGNLGIGGRKPLGF